MRRPPAFAVALALGAAGAAWSGCQLVAGIDERFALPDDASGSPPGDGAASDVLVGPDGGRADAFDANLPDGSCFPGTRDCLENTPRSCNDRVWVAEAPCSGSTPVCAGAGVCAANRSCQSNAPGAGRSCGASASDDCCTSLMVPGGTFDRVNDPTAPATVGPFHLDRYEVTVDRFRAFVAAGKGVRTSPPSLGDGAHPGIASSGWASAFNAYLAPDTNALRKVLVCDPLLRTWTDAAGLRAQETLPINCVSWYEAFAFCAWDGGRLPTEAEFSFSGVGGAQQRAYPWSDPPDASVLDSTYAAYACNGSPPEGLPCVPADILPVGSRSPKGDGAYGQADLAGNVWEWLLDVSGPLKTPCVDCANLVNGGARAEIGGAFGSGPDYMLNSRRASDQADSHLYGHGIRCARP